MAQSQSSPRCTWQPQGGGKGLSFQHVEQKDQHDVMRQNYIMEHRRMAQRPIISKMYLAAPRGVDMNHYMGMNQMRQMDRHQIAMGRNHVDMYGRNVNLEKKQEEFQEQIAQVFQQTVDRTASTRIEQAIQQQLEETLSEALKHINKGLDLLEISDVLNAALKSQDDH